MASDHTATIFWILAAMQLTGLTSTLLARLSEGHRHQSICQTFFLANLTLVGGATIMALVLGCNFWLFSGTTVSIMAVGATLEVSRPQSSTVT